MILNDFTTLDIETTGLNPKMDKIIEVGAVRVRNGEITEKFESLVNPGRKLEKRIVSLTGICDLDLKNAPNGEEVIPKLLAFLGEDVLVGHRILFDYSFVKKAAVNLKLPFEKQGIDTLKIARRFLPELESRKLDFLCWHYGISLHAHRAVCDAEGTAMLYLRLAKDFPVEEAFNPNSLVYKVKKESPATKQQKERLYKLIEAHKLIIDYDIDKLTRNEASRLADKIVLQYGRG